VVSGDRHLELTGEGRRKAVHVMRKHRLAERLLSDVIELEWEFVHEEACRWEHVMSEQVERKLLTMLGHPTVSPYGNPIPGLDELGEVDTTPTTQGLINLVNVVEGRDSGVTASIRRLGEPAQVDPELLLQLKQAGVIPGSTGTFSSAGSYVIVQIDGFENGLELPNELAAHIFVDA